MGQESVKNKEPVYLIHTIILKNLAVQPQKPDAQVKFIISTFPSGVKEPAGKMVFKQLLVSNFGLGSLYLIKFGSKCSHGIEIPCIV